MCSCWSCLGCDQADADRGGGLLVRAIEAGQGGSQALGELQIGGVVTGEGMGPGESQDARSPLLGRVGVGEDGQADDPGQEAVAIGWGGARSGVQLPAGHWPPPDARGLEPTRERRHSPAAVDPPARHRRLADAETTWPGPWRVRSRWSTASLRHEAGYLGIRDAQDARGGLKGGDGGGHGFGAVRAVGNQISHGLAGQGDREPLALLHGPQQPGKLGLGLEGANADVHDLRNLVHVLVYKS